MHLLRPMTVAAMACTIAALSLAQTSDTKPLTDSLPSQWVYATDRFQPLPSSDKWWDTFDDPELTKLISGAIDNNFNLAAASRRIAIARQQLKAARSGYYPQFSASAGWSRSQSSGNTGSVSMPRSTADFFSLGVDMAWQIDVFGRINSKTKQLADSYQASRAEYDAAMVTLCGNVATAYIQVRTWELELGVARVHLASQGRVLNIAKARHEAGLASKLDVAQAQTVYYSTEAVIPQLENSIATGRNALAVLLGVYPEQIGEYITPREAIPDYKRIVSIGVPADLLRRRPDVIAAEYSLAAAAAAVGVAKKDFLPTISLDGSIGLQSHSLKNIAKGRSVTYSIAPRLSWTIFDGMARNASLAIAREEMMVQIDSYNNTLLTAVQEVQNAITTYSNLLLEIQNLQQVLNASKEAFDLSIDLYKQGLTAFTNVAQAQISYLQYADQLVSSQGQAAVELVNLYEALGGGWESE